MAVQFTIWDYWGELILLTFGTIAVFLVTAVPLMRFLARKTGNTGIALLPVLLIVPLMAALFAYALPVGERTECLYPEERAYTHTTAGTITEVRPAEHIPLYYENGEFLGGVYVTIGGTEYYSMAHPLLTGGTSLHFTYCPEDDLIVAFSPIGAHEVAALQTPFVMPEATPEEPVPEKAIPVLQEIIGTILSCTGFLSLLAIIGFADWFKLRATIFLLKRDRLQRGEVVPNPAVLLAASVLLVPFAMIVSGSVLTGSDSDMLVFLALAAPLMLGFLWLRAAHVRLEGRIIRIRRFGRERTVPLSTLRAVEWTSIYSPLDQRCLVLYFDHGTLHLDQESHCGLEDLHRRLSALLNITH